jgi:protein ImuA
MANSLTDPEAIHPSLWRAHGLGSAVGSVRSSGFAALDAQLPGGGWPCRTLTELLLPRPGLGEMRLLAPVLHAGVSTVMLFDPPALPCAQAMAQLGVDPRRLTIIHGREGVRGAALRHRLTAADVLWALEHGLRSGALDAVLAWLPDRLGAQVLRRLQLAAQSHDGPVFLLRSIEVRLRPSPAPLRLALHPGPVPDELVVQVLKRRGCGADQPLRLALPAVLPAAARARWQDAANPPSTGVPRPGRADETASRLALGWPA